ncbi:unnamed protein product [Prorocentrum cordatum]|uniref:Uncharacterized protein n=1 Tax=Prorocentrum cordatum TaxID=2364126 RepID=A0ABN9S1X1_9DINO|nr:unnamed protein product [Polarella glacialis]
MGGARAWATKATARGTDAEENARQQAPVVSEALGKVGDILRQLAEIPAKLSLANSAELRDACGVIYTICLIMSDQPSTQAVECRKEIETYWAETLVLMPLERIGERARHCRVESKAERTRLASVVGGEFTSLEKNPIRYLVSAGGERRLGPDPRGALEREAPRLLERPGEGKAEKKQEDE